MPSGYTVADILGIMNLIWRFQMFTLLELPIREIISSEVLMYVSLNFGTWWMGSSVVIGINVRYMLRQ
jgi:hypothetical protein